MHELSLCIALMEQLEAIAEVQQATGIEEVVLRLGPLSGVEEALLRHAFPVAAAGSVAAGAMLTIEHQPLRIHCRECGADSEATPSRLLCGECGSAQTTLISGDELLLARVTLLCPPEKDARGTSDVR